MLQDGARYCLTPTALMTANLCAGIASGIFSPVGFLSPEGAFGGNLPPLTACVFHRHNKISFCFRLQ